MESESKAEMYGSGQLNKESWADERVKLLFKENLSANNVLNSLIIALKIIMGIIVHVSSNALVLTGAFLKISYVSSVNVLAPKTTWLVVTVGQLLVMTACKVLNIAKEMLAASQIMTNISQLDPKPVNAEQRYSIEAGLSVCLRMLAATVRWLVDSVNETVLWLLLWPGPIVILFIMFIANLQLQLVIVAGRLLGLAEQKVFHVARTCVAKMFVMHGRILHDWQVSGLGNIPRTGPCLITFYHGPLPLDYLYLVSTVYLETGRLVNTIVDRSLFLLPGLRTLAIVMNCASPSRQQCIRLLSTGRLVGVAPGGGLESMLGGRHCSISWGGRKGYAVAAAAAGCPVVPVFSSNIRKVFRTLQWTRPVSQLIYTASRLAMSPVYGGLPIRIRTYVGGGLDTSHMSADRVDRVTRRRLGRMISSYDAADSSYARLLADRLAGPSCLDRSLLTVLARLLVSTVCLYLLVKSFKMAEQFTLHLSMVGLYSIFVYV